MKKVVAVLLVIIIAVVAFLYFPRGGVIEAAQAAVLAVLNGDVDAQRSGQPVFEPALDGDVFATGDVVRANERGRAVLTFFEGSTLSVEPSSHVRVVSLTRTGGGGLQLTLEQTLGRTWAAVSTLAGSDSKFEIRTPSMVATVRGTAFETIVEQTPDGKTVTTIKTSEGEVLVKAVAGGEVSVGAGEQVQVQEGQPAPPAPEPQPPTPRLRFSAPPGVGFTVIDPRGLQCGSAGAVPQRQIPRCELLGGAGQSVVIGDVVAGGYSILATAAQPVADATIVAEGLGIQGTDFTHRVVRSLAVGDLMRTGLPVTVAADGKLGSPGFSPPELITSVCGAEATGRVFSGGSLQERVDLLAGYAQEAKGQPAAIVMTAAEITRFAAESVAEAGTSLPVTVSGVGVTIDNAGLHFSASVTAGPLSVPARADLIAGAAGGKLVIRLRNLEAGPVPQVAKEQLVRAVDEGLADIGDSFPLVVERVAFRAGCMAVIGKTPG